MHIINVTVRDKIAAHVGDVYYVCGNSDFVVHFDFDEEWDALDVKTARFICEDGSFRNQVFSGSECPVPIVSNTNSLRVGVFAGNLCTTTPARVPAAKSILCPGGMPAAPEDDAYHQVMEEMAKVGHEARSSAEASAQSAQEAAQAAASAGMYLDNVGTNAKAAAASAQAAKQSETAAAASAGSAEKAKQAAIDNADDAEEAAKSAQEWAGCAETYASNSGTAADAAATSAQAAKQSESAAAASAEAAKKSVDEIPDALPNPHKLTFSGASDVEYDGSEAVDVSIPDVYIVKATQDENYKVWADRTQAEIRAAVKAGKAVIVVDHMGEVFHYVGEYSFDSPEGNSGNVPTFFSDFEYSYGVLSYHRVFVLADGRASYNGYGKVKTPTPYALTVGGVAYDGSKMVTVMPAPADKTATAYLRWNGTGYVPATIDRLKADLGLT